jgi:hypothetical protein
MQTLGMSVSRSVIQIVNGRGADKDLGTLVEALIGPELKEFHDPQYVLLNRPATRLLIASDAEGHYAPSKLARTRARYIKYLSDSLLRLYDVRVPASELEPLVQVITWGKRQFEFSCFTDRQLANAINACREKSGGHAVSTASVALARNSQDPNVSFRRLLTQTPKVTKPRLANQLSSVMVNRLRIAEQNNTLERYPISRLLLRTSAIARAVIQDETLLRIQS